MPHAARRGGLLGHRLLREQQRQLPEQREPDQRRHRHQELHQAADRGRVPAGQVSERPDEVSVREHALLPVREPQRRRRRRGRRLPANVACCSHAVQANTAPYNPRPTSPENDADSPTTKPTASPVAGPTNGKYLATLVCVTCHTVDVTNSTPKLIDAGKAFQGGRVVTTTVNNATKMLQSANLTPSASGLMSWNITQVANAITTAKDKNGVALCGMRALANMSTSDATDIASYLLSIPPVANTITMTCQ